MAEGGPPPIDWQAGTVVSNEPLARGTRLLRVQAESELPYKPGHIFGLEIDHPTSGDSLKGPYTITRSTRDIFDVIYRVIPDGRKTPFFDKLEAGANVRFGGAFGTPVADGIAPDCDRVVGVATGTGVGPLLGFAEQALSERSDAPMIELYCAFSDLADVCGADAEALAQRFPDRFRWTPVISRPMACTAVAMSTSSFVSAALGGSDTSAVTDASTGGDDGPFAQGRITSVLPAMLGEVSARTHFHLVGNGQFVADLSAGLAAAGVAEDRVTTEKYFNGKAVANADVVDFVAKALQVE